MGASVLPLGEALDRLNADSLPRQSVSLTFDDGFSDFLKHGVPILSEFGYPCTLYLTTHYCDYPVPIIGLILHYLLWKSRRPSLRLPQFGMEQEMVLESYEDRQRVVRHLVNWAEERKFSTLEKDAIARQLAESSKH